MSTPLAAPDWLWAVFAVAAAAGQTLRNALQRSLVDTVGTAGATHVRFLYGLPFGVLFLLLVWLAGGIVAPVVSWSFWFWLTLGASTQIIATALMLTLMQRRSFVVSTAYIKTEPVLIAVFGFVFLDDLLSVSAVAAVVIATAGVFALSWPRATVAAASGATSPQPFANDGWGTAALLGITAGATFALSVVGFRGAILALGDDPFYGRATLALVASLALQTALLSMWLAWREPGRLRQLAGAWRASTLAGFTGAAASQCWFLAFSLQAAALVRTVGLVEVLFAMMLSRRMFAQHASAREMIGIGLIIVGVALLLNVAS
ncbi:MAG: EamA/RhaT family transporter [Proteobacteria bacterium]|nr:EamA/RhaT family transporter [Burkholderiales bacterium]